jgi:hypothetical protein
MDWVSLFQDSEEVVRMEDSEFSQYSCSWLLREMEAAEIESDEEENAMCLDDAELVRFPGEWINKESESMKVEGLLDDLYSLAEWKMTLHLITKGWME